MIDNRILIVDDEPGIIKVLDISLADSGYEVTTALDGREALRLFQEIQHPIVLTDIKMPGLDGIELLRAIKNENPETEVIMMTGHGDMDLAIKSLEYDATDFITKPIGDQALEIALKRAQERIAVRAQLREYTENLEQLVEIKTRDLLNAERLAAVGQTAAGLSHAIKNIAGGLKGGAFVLEKGMELEHKEYLAQGWEMIRTNVDKIIKLSFDLLDLGKPSAISPKPCHPHQPARDIFELMKARAEKDGVVLKLDMDESLQPFSFDNEAIHRCLLNLVTNSLDACRGQDIGHKQVAIIVSAAPGWGALYRIEDTCGGMAAGVQEKIFHNFFTTKGPAGFGLGLMITKKIIEDHGGVIELESKKGMGSVFTFKLPAAPTGS